MSVIKYELMLREQVDCQNYEGQKHFSAIQDFFRTFQSTWYPLREAMQTIKWMADLICSVKQLLLPIFSFKNTEISLSFSNFTDEFFVLLSKSSRACCQGYIPEERTKLPQSPVHALTQHLKILFLWEFCLNQVQVACFLLLHVQMLTPFAHISFFPIGSFSWCFPTNIFHQQLLFFLLQARKC